MNRLWLVAVIAIAIFVSSDCLTFKDGKIINRCGVWQFSTKSSLVLLVESKKPIPVVNISPGITSSILPVTGTVTTNSVSICSNGNTCSLNGTGTVIYAKPTMTMSSMVMGITSASMTIQACNWQGDICTWRNR